MYFSTMQYVLTHVSLPIDQLRNLCQTEAEMIGIAFKPSDVVVSLDGTVAGLTKQIKCSRTFIHLYNQAWARNIWEFHSGQRSKSILKLQISFSCQWCHSFTKNWFPSAMSSMKWPLTSSKTSIIYFTNKNQVSFYDFKESREML